MENYEKLEKVQEGTYGKSGTRRDARPRGASSPEEDPARDGRGGGPIHSSCAKFRFEMLSQEYLHRQVGECRHGPIATLPSFSLDVAKTPLFASLRQHHLCCLDRLLSVEHVDEGGKPMLYLVFEFLDTDFEEEFHGHEQQRPWSPA